MSTWALFSMMGFYPHCPGVPEYTLTAPVFDKVTIKLDPKYYKQSELVITANGAADIRTHIKSMTLGGKPLKKYVVTHDELLKAGTLHFDMK
jgi:putative alpha-1,2-mannosidase